MGRPRAPAKQSADTNKVVWKDGHTVTRARRVLALVHALGSACQSSTARHDGQTRAIGESVRGKTLDRRDGGRLAFKVLMPRLI